MSHSINIITTDDCIESIGYSTDLSIIKKKLCTEALEINSYQFAKDALFFLDQPENPNGIKTYTIIKGTCISIETNKVLQVGDLLIIKYPQEVLHFRAIEETHLMVHGFFNSPYNNWKTHANGIVHIMKKIQEKDAYTQSHCKRVFNYAQAVALRCDINGQRLFNLGKASQFHDVGKISIPDSILNKPDSLTLEESKIMESHVINGKPLITKFFHEDVFNIIKLHHERIDGTGYPNGLKGDEIPIEGKILAICDSFDAMVTHRIYKHALGVPDAIKELQNAAGTKFDPHLVTVFIDVFNKKFR